MDQSQRLLCKWSRVTYITTTKHRNKIYVSILMSIFRLEQRKRKTASILTVFNQKLTSEHLLCTASSKNSEISLTNFYAEAGVFCIKKD